MEFPAVLKAFLIGGRLDTAVLPRMRAGARQDRGAPESACESAVPVVSFMDTSIGTLASTPWSTPILESTLAANNPPDPPILAFSISLFFFSDFPCFWGVFFFLFQGF